MNYIKMSPLTGMVGYGGGSSGLNVSGGTKVPFFGDRGLIHGGWEDNQTSLGENGIQYFAITSTGNTSDFGDLTTERQSGAAASNGTRGVQFGGQQSDMTIIDYITIANTGNATDFGDLNVGRRLIAGYSNGAIAWCAGGKNGGDSNVIDYWTIDTTGDASDFGDLSANRKNLSGCGNNDRGMTIGGWTSGTQYDIDYFDPNTPGNAADFGDIGRGMAEGNCTSNETRGLAMGGYDFSADAATDSCEYITISTLGNTSSFGDLDQVRTISMSSCSNGTRATFNGGNDSNNAIKSIRYFTIDTTGNSTNFGDMDTERQNISGGNSGD